MTDIKSGFLGSLELKPWGWPAMGGTFSSGKNNSLRSDIFSRQKMYPPPPSFGLRDWVLGREKKGICISRYLMGISARGGRWIFRRKRCLSEASSFSKKNSTVHPASPPLNRQATRRGNQINSMATAVPSPPPIHSEATPRFSPRCFRALIRVTMIREPEEPIGCPRAQAPP